MEKYDSIPSLSDQQTSSRVFTLLVVLAEVQYYFLLCIPYNSHRVFCVCPEWCWNVKCGFQVPSLYKFSQNLLMVVPTNLAWFGWTKFVIPAEIIALNSYYYGILLTAEMGRLYDSAWNTTVVAVGNRTKLSSAGNLMAFVARTLHISQDVEGKQCDKPECITRTDEASQLWCSVHNIEGKLCEQHSITSYRCSGFRCI